MPCRLLVLLLAAIAASAAHGDSPPLEELFEWRARDPEEAFGQPRRWLTPEWLAERDAAVYGWVAAGIGGNASGSSFNGPVVMNDRDGQGMLNQLYLTGLRSLGDTVGWGGRLDLLYGTDWWTAVARGLDARPFNEVDALGVPRWNSSRYYGLAMPQAYLEYGREDVSILVGHFYTVLGYEVVPAVGNFFASRTYVFEYATPTSHTGILGTWRSDHGLSVVAGFMNGWDNFSDSMPVFLNPEYPGASSNAALIGEVTLASDDDRGLVAFAMTSGNEYTPRVDDHGTYHGAMVGNLTMYTLYGMLEVTDRLTCVVEHANAWQFHADTGFANAGQLPGLAQWYGITSYTYLALLDRLAAGLRIEWFRDNNGSRVFYPIRNAVTGADPVAGGFAGNFWAVTWGLNWVPQANWMVRPELRYDWYTPDGYGSGALPFGGINGGPGGVTTGDASGQFYGGCDVVVQF